jgi:hypothetical protein
MTEPGALLEILTVRAYDDARPLRLLGGVDFMTLTHRVLTLEDGSCRLRRLPAEARVQPPTADAPEAWLLDPVTPVGASVAKRARECRIIPAPLLSSDDLETAEASGALMDVICEALGRPVSSSAHAVPVEMGAAWWRRITGTESPVRVLDTLP